MQKGSRRSRTALAPAGAVAAAAAAGAGAVIAMEVMVIRRAPELMLISELDIHSFLSACIGSRLFILSKRSCKV